MAKAKQTRARGTRPWGGLAKELVKIGVDPLEAEEQSWILWFENKCPLNFAMHEANPEKMDDLLKELFEQTSGRFVEDEGKEVEEEDDDDDDQHPGDDDTKTEQGS